MPSECKFSTFTATAMRFTSYSDGSLGPKVVQPIGTSNKMRTFFVVICVFFEDYGLRERAVRRRRRTQTSVKRVAVRRVGAAANCAVRRTANILIIYSGSSLRRDRVNERMRIAGLRCGRLRPAQSCGLHYLRAADSLKPPEPFSPAAI